MQTKALSSGTKQSRNEMSLSRNRSETVRSRSSHLKMQRLKKRIFRWLTTSSSNN